MLSGITAQREALPPIHMIVPSELGSFNICHEVTLRALSLSLHQLAPDTSTASAQTSLQIAGRRYMITKRIIQSIEPFVYTESAPGTLNLRQARERKTRCFTAVQNDLTVRQPVSSRARSDLQ